LKPASYYERPGRGKEDTEKTGFKGELAMSVTDLF
jgi:hypothetical protein